MDNCPLEEAFVMPHEQPMKFTEFTELLTKSKHVQKAPVNYIQVSIRSGIFDRSLILIYLSSTKTPILPRNLIN